MRIAALAVFGVIAVTPVNAQLACNPVDFVRAPELPLYVIDQGTAGAMMRQSDGSFALHQYETFAPYRKRETVARFDDRLYNCVPESLKPRPPLASSPRPGQLKLGSASWAYDLVDLNGQEQLAIVGVYSRIARNAVAVGLLNPDLSVRTSATYPVTQNPTEVVTADFNGDRLRDIAVISFGANFETGGTVAILLGNADGTFRTGASVALGFGPYSLTAADFNGDQRVDLAIVSYPKQSVSVLLGNGDGTFRPPATINLNAFGYRVLAADVNGDGRLDLIVPAETPGSKSIYTLLGNGDGSFRTPAIISAAGSQANGAAMGDFNKDGRLDLAIVSSPESLVSILLGDGTGRFTVRSRYAGGYSPNSLRVADVNLDGNTDVVLGTGEPDALTHQDNSTTIAVLFGRGDGTFHGAPAFPLADSPGAPAFADFNGDGVPDLAVTGAFSDNLAVALGRGDGSFQEPSFTRLIVPGNTQGLIRGLVAGDFNRDGKMDLAGAGRNLYILLGNGNGTFQNPTAIDSGGQLTSIASADLNGDQRLDFVVASSLSNPTPNSGFVAAVLATATGYQAAVRLGSVTDPRQVQVDDLNGDQRPDVVAVDYGLFSGPEAGGLQVFLGNGNGTFQTRVSYPAGKNPSHVRAADLNGDGRRDLVVSTGEGDFGSRYGILFGRAAGGFDPVRLNRTDFGPGDIAVADFSGDGKVDLAIAHCCGDVVLEVLAGNGDGTFSLATSFVIESSWLLAGDWNRDGRSDLLTVSSDGVRVLVNANRSAGVLTAVSAASVTAGPVAADSLVSAFGAGLAPAAKGAETIPLPLNLEGTTVVVRDARGTERQAGLSFVSPGQVNFLVPAGTATGAATVLITSGNTVSAGRVEIANIGPGIFQLNAAGLAAATVLRVNAAGERSVESVFSVAEGAVVAAPIDPGPEGDRVFLTVYGTGFRRGGARTTTVRIGGVETPVLFIGAQPDFPGLDQVNVELPRSLAGRGVVELEMTVTGVRANAVNLAVK